MTEARKSTLYNAGRTIDPAGIGGDSPFWIQGASRQTSGRVLYERIDSVVAVRLAYRTPEESATMLLAAGDAKSGGIELAALAQEILPPKRTMIERTIYDALDDSLREFYGPYWGWEWDYYWTNSPLGAQPYSKEVKFLANSQLEVEKRTSMRILQVLKNSNTTTQAVAEFQNYNWFYLENSAGEIVSVVGMDIKDQVAELHGLGTLPEHRGHGYGSALMVGATAQSFSQGVKALQFGMWHWNKNARRIYQRLGFQQAGIFLSGAAHPFPDLEKQAR